MRVEVTKLTDIDLMREACDATRKVGTDSFRPSTMSLKRMYQCEHSPARTQLFKIRLEGIPTFVSVHLVRHSATGQQHFVESNRDDRMEDMDGSSLTYKGFTQDFFLDTFEYKNGELFWKRRLHPRSKYKVGDLAGTKSGRDNRISINAGGEFLYRSVVIYMMFAGYRPPVVDHINGDPTDDRIENLRAATFLQNTQNNHNRRYNNKTGYKGVKQERSGNYVARIHHNESEIHLGTFSTPEAAALAYDAAAIKYFNEFAALNFPDKNRPITREEKVNHLMILNAQHLMDMAGDRLCYNAHKTTVGIFSRIRKAVRRVDQDLAEFMVPKCVRLGYCPELRACPPGPVKVILAHRENWIVMERARVNNEIVKAVMP